MNVGYEEKTFETYFNMELAKQGFIFPFGQAQEGIFGTDASVNLKTTSALWNILNNQPISANITLNDIEQHLNQTVNNTLSSIKANIFFQYKKPEWVTSPTAHQRKEWGCDYFRYHLRYPLTKNQQKNNKKEQLDILLDIEKQFGNQALVLYASPAIEDLPKLISIVQQGNLINHTNFVRLSKLNGTHNKITYIQGGTHFKAHSEVETVICQSLMEHISQIESNQESNHDQICFLAKAIQGVISILSNDIPFKRAFEYRMAMFDSEIQSYSLLSSIITLKAFTEISAMNWIIKLNQP